jgi:SAM-dependent methyltransferase
MDAVRCPRCSSPLHSQIPKIHCGRCGQHFPRLGSLPVLLREPEIYLQSCRAQLDLLEKQAARTIQSIEEQLTSGDVLPATRQRCLAMIDAIREQTTDIQSVLIPFRTISGSHSMPEQNQTPAPLQYIHYLYRDWGWPSEPNGENERALAAVQHVAEGNSFGHMLVLGAGACRLAYDLHRLDATSETIVLDIDPFLFTAAHQVIRGGLVTLREANAEIDEVDQVVKEWILKAPHGAIGEDRFHFMLADGLEPPFAAETFDTVVTPWFIDLVPSDLRNLISQVHRLLKPGGRWLNLGPLRYKPGAPVIRRFAREEVFDLAARCGMPIYKWRTETMPYLVSKLNGRGKIESVLVFAATKLKNSLNGRTDGPPPWLLFGHVPIPTFPNPSAFRTEDPAEMMVLEAIDGNRTLDDIAGILASHAGETGLTRDQFREIVRQCLLVVHPGTKR